MSNRKKRWLLWQVFCIGRFVIFYAFLRISLCMNVIPLQYLVKDPFCHLEQPTDHQHRREGFHKDGSEQRERSLNLHLHPNQPLSGCTHCRHSRVSLQGRWNSQGPIPLLDILRVGFWVWGFIGIIWVSIIALQPQTRPFIIRVGFWGAGRNLHLFYMHGVKTCASSRNMEV